MLPCTGLNPFHLWRAHAEGVFDVSHIQTYINGTSPAATMTLSSTEMMFRIFNGGKLTISNKDSLGSRPRGMQ
jgi:hypothetical protein